MNKTFSGVQLLEIDRISWGYFVIIRRPYLHWIDKFFTSHKRIFYDAIQLLFKIQQILYHALIFFRIQNDAGPLFLKHNIRNENTRFIHLDLSHVTSTNSPLQQIFLVKI